MSACLSLAAGVLIAAAAGAEPSAELARRIHQLEANVTAAEDVSAIKKLQRAYGYYLDKGMWADLAELFTDDAVASYPAGVFVGKESIRAHLFLNVGGGKMGEVGLGDGRLYNHMNLQPVVHLDAGGRSAQGRWRAFAMFGRFGGGATWAEGVYEIVYARENGLWKIRKLDYYAGFAAPYETGWVAPQGERASRAGGRRLAHPPDREWSGECRGFPDPCIAPFHYGNPVTSASAHVWEVPQLSNGSARGDIRARLASLARRARLLRDEQQIENLQRAYGYYLDRALWDHVADLFAEDGSIELGLQGVYVGRRRVREFLGRLGPHGLRPGWLNDHLQMQIVVDVAPDGLTARARSRELAMTGEHGARGTWSAGIYENTFVKQDGVWKFQSVHFYPTFITDYDEGWSKSALAPPASSREYPPDRPPTELYEIYPKAHVPPFHYRNPVTGKPPQYPPAGAGGPARAAAAAMLMPVGRTPRLAPVRDIEAALAQAEQDIARVKDHHEIENLQNAYGYYLDKNLWNELGNLFAREASMELAQRGVYRSQDRIRAFLLRVFGRGGEGPVAGRLGNHLQLQPVITVAEDGRSAKVRSRMLQQMSFGERASLGAAIYENEAVKEDGVWKLSKVHAFNTFTASYRGGWAKGANPTLPGPSQDFPPDGPPTKVYQAFPDVSDIPFHYANPVSGRTEVPALALGAAVAGSDAQH